MPNPSARRFAQFWLLMGDLFWLNLAFLGAVYLRFPQLELRDTPYFDYYLQLWLTINLLFLVLSAYFKSHHLRPHSNSGSQLARVWQSLGSHLFLILIVLVSLQKGDQYSRLFLSYFYLFAFLGLSLWRIIWQRWRQDTHRFQRKVILIGEGKTLQQWKARQEAERNRDIEVLATYSSREADWQKIIEELPHLAGDEVYISLPQPRERLRELLDLAERATMRVRLLPNLDLDPVKSMEVQNEMGLPVLALRPEPLQFRHHRMRKRLLDLSLGGLALLLTFPTLVLPLALLIRLRDWHSPFFLQQRQGYRNQPFVILKLRTLREKNQKPTPLGRWLRQHHLDELPQLWNVVKGEMSLVGPRPHSLEDHEAYSSLIKTYMVRHLVKPGITGLAQIRGWKGPLDQMHMQMRVRYDVEYLENWRFSLDLEIIWRSLWVMLRGAQSISDPNQ